MAYICLCLGVKRLAFSDVGLVYYCAFCSVSVCSFWRHYTDSASGSVCCVTMAMFLSIVFVVSLTGLFHLRNFVVSGWETPV